MKPVYDGSNPRWIHLPNLDEAGVAQRWGHETGEPCEVCHVRKLKPKSCVCGHEAFDHTPHYLKASWAPDVAFTLSGPCRACYEARKRGSLGVNCLGFALRAPACPSCGNEHFDAYGNSMCMCEPVRNVADWRKKFEACDNTIRSMSSQIADLARWKADAMAVMSIEPARNELAAIRLFLGLKDDESIIERLRLLREQVSGGSEYVKKQLREAGWYANLEHARGLLQQAVDKFGPGPNYPPRV